jgi:hypothetical protein
MKVIGFKCHTKGFVRQRGHFTLVAGPMQWKSMMQIIGLTEQSFPTFKCYHHHKNFRYEFKRNVFLFVLQSI